MSKSSEYAILVNAEERERQALAQREQDYFNTLYIEDKLPKETKQTPKTEEDNGIRKHAE